MKGDKKELDVPANFFENYQTYFRLLVFPTEQGQLRNDYQPRVCFIRFNLYPVTDGFPEDKDYREEYWLHKIGGQPIWLQFDDAPTTYAGHIPMYFLMQIDHDFEFETVPQAPPQMVTDYVTSNLEPSGEPYFLFLGGGAWFFGSADPNSGIVYVVIQN